MITGAHSVIYSSNHEADKLFFKNILKFPYVDIGRGWLIFGLPPAELAMHPANENGLHEFYLMCDDIKSFIKEMAKQKIRCSKIKVQPWGNLVSITLPGGGKLGVYEPKHARPKNIKKISKPRKK